MTIGRASTNTIGTPFRRTSVSSSAVSSQAALTMAAAGAVKPKALSQLAANLASGGTTVDVTNYNGTGQTWRVHTFTAGDTLTVTRSVSPFTILVCGAGTAGGTGYIVNGGGSAGAGGAGGNYLYDAAASLPVAAHAVTVGTNGAASTLGASYSSASGAAGGAANSAGVTYTITGASVGYCGGGGTGAFDTQDGNTANGVTGSPGYDGGGAGGDAQADYIAGYSTGADGVRGGGGGGGAGANSFYDSGQTRAGGNSTGTVIVAYRIG